MKIKELIKETKTGKELIPFKNDLLKCDEFKNVNKLEIINNLQEIYYKPVIDNNNIHSYVECVENVDLITVDNPNFYSTVRLYAIVVKENNIKFRCSRMSIL